MCYAIRPLSPPWSAKRLYSWLGRICKRTLDVLWRNGLYGFSHASSEFLLLPGSFTAGLGGDLAPVTGDNPALLPFEGRPAYGLISRLLEKIYSNFYVKV